MRPLRLSPGETFLDTYRVVKLLGQGSMGRVYLTESLADQKLYALKTMRPEALQDERALARFEREATLSQQLDSDHVVKTLAAGIEPETQTPWMVMEFVEGKQLDEYLEESPSMPDRQRVLDQIFAAVAAAHAKGFVHRDLKPENILVRATPQGPHVKLLDFGVVKQLGISPNNSTAQGLGTPLWTAPEQGTSRGLSSSADVWALGLLAFFTLTGRFYWRNANREKASVLDLILELERGEIVAPTARLTELGQPAVLPEGFDAWFERCVHRDPAARLVDAAQAHRHLREVLDQRPHTMPPMPPPSSAAVPVAIPRLPPVRISSPPASRAPSQLPLAPASPPQAVTAGTPGTTLRIGVALVAALVLVGVVAAFLLR